MSALDLRRWSQNGCWVMWASSLSTRPVECPSFKEAPSLCALRHKLRCHARADVPRPGRRAPVGCPLWQRGVAAITPGPAHASPAALSRESCRLLARLRALLAFAGLRKHPLRVAISRSAVERTCAGADHLGE